jgi:hypothetical protein
MVMAWAFMLLLLLMLLMLLRGCKVCHALSFLLVLLELGVDALGGVVELSARVLTPEGVAVDVKLVRLAARGGVLLLGASRALDGKIYLIEAHIEQVFRKSLVRPGVLDDGGKLEVSVKEAEKRARGGGHVWGREKMTIVAEEGRELGGDHLGRAALGAADERGGAKSEADAEEAVREEANGILNSGVGGGGVIEAGVEVGVLEGEERGFKRDKLVEAIVHGFNGGGERRCGRGGEALEGGL